MLFHELLLISIESSHVSNNKKWFTVNSKITRILVFSYQNIIKTCMNLPKQDAPQWTAFVIRTLYLAQDNLPLKFQGKPTTTVDPPSPVLTDDARPETSVIFFNCVMGFPYLPLKQKQLEELLITHAGHIYSGMYTYVESKYLLWARHSMGDIPLVRREMWASKGLGTKASLIGIYIGFIPVQIQYAIIYDCS